MTERQYDMTGVWALDALDEVERADVEAYLAQDPSASAEAEAFRETAAVLAAGMPPVAPRPDLKDSLMAQVSRTRQLPPTVVDDHGDRAVDVGTAAGPTAREVVPLDRYRAARRRTRWASAAAAALLVTTITGAGLWAAERAQHERADATIEALESTRADGDREQAMMRTIMGSDDATHLTLPSSAGGSLQVLYSRDQEAMIVRAADLPELPAGRTYQLWMIDEDGPQDAGLLADPDESAMRSGPMSEQAQLGLSIEPAGGSPQPTDVVAVGEL